MSAWEVCLLASTRRAWLSWLESDCGCIHPTMTYERGLVITGVFPSTLVSCSLFHSKPVPGKRSRKLLNRNAWCESTLSGNSSVLLLINESACPSIHPFTHPLIHRSIHPSSKCPCPRHSIYRYLVLMWREVRHRTCSQGNIIPVVMYECESWTIKKAEHWRTDAFELWYWRRLLRVPWTARRSNQSILKEISPENSLEGLMLKLKLQYFGHLMWSQLIRKDPDAGKDWGQEEKLTTEDEMAGWHHRLTGHEFESTSGVGDGQGGLVCCSPWACKESDMTERLNWSCVELWVNCWIGLDSEGTHSLDSDLSSASYFLHGLRQVTPLLWASIPWPVRWR